MGMTEQESKLIPLREEEVASVPWGIKDACGILLIMFLACILSIRLFPVENSSAVVDYLLYGLFLGLTIYVATKKYKVSSRRLGYTWPALKDNASVSSVFIFSGSLGLLFLGIFIASGSLIAHNQTQQLHASNLPDVIRTAIPAIPVVPFTVKGFAQVVLVPLSEEIFYRGFLLQALFRSMKLPALAIAIQAIIFALFHINPFEPFWIVEAVEIIAMGFVLGWLFLRYRSIFPSFILHSVYNWGQALLKYALLT